MLTIRHDSAGNLHLAGELDSASVHQLAAALSREPERTGDLCLSCADLTFIDSSGIRGLVRAAKKLAEAGRVLVLVSPGRALTRLFDLPQVSSYMAGICVEPPPAGAFGRSLSFK
jgi:anti-anti-sigma factor